MHPWIWGATFEYYDWAMRECHCGAPGCDRVQRPVWRATGIAALRYDRGAVVQPEGPLEVVNSFGATGSRAAHQVEVRTSLQPSREVLITMTGDCWSQKHIDGDPWCWRRAALRREQLGNGSVRPNSRGMKSGRHRGWKQNRQGPIWRGDTFHEGDHRCHRHIPSEKMWWYACRLLWTCSLKEGSLWHDGWRPE
jgi:hypothetical protein